MFGTALTWKLSIVGRLPDSYLGFICPYTCQPALLIASFFDSQVDQYDGIHMEKCVKTTPGDKITTTRSC